MNSFILSSDIDEILDTLPASVVESFYGRRILITGGMGFLGRYFISFFNRLNAQRSNRFMPCELIALDNLITAGDRGREVSQSREFAFVEHDIINPFYPERPVDYIIHAAGIASPFWYRKYPVETLKVSTVGTENILQLARKNRGSKTIVFSSSEIYGDPDARHVPTAESYRGNISCLGARACYDEGKRVGETYCRVFHETYGVDVKMVRPFNVYGPGMQKTDYRVLPNFGSKIMEGKPLHIYGDGSQTRTFCYVTDAIRGFLQVLVDGVPGEPYNIGNPAPEISMINLAKEISAVLGKEAMYELVEYPDTYPGDEPMRRCPDITKAKTQVGFNPAVTLQDGLKRFFGWAAEMYPLT
jgi:UDP-glucuronate decarboxylase